MFVFRAPLHLDTALKFAYDSMPEDLGGLAAKMGLMGGVVLGMSILVAPFNKMGSNAKSLFKLVLIAGSIRLGEKVWNTQIKLSREIVLEFGSKIIKPWYWSGCYCHTRRNCR